MRRPLRNIAIIAHVDHGKTTLVDKLLQQAGTFAAHTHLVERVMDSGDIERERGITILAKNTAVDYHGVHINIVDTPAMRISVARSSACCDGRGGCSSSAGRGPDAATRFVTRKALARAEAISSEQVDREAARSALVVDQTFDLRDKLGATETSSLFPRIARRRYGCASTEVNRWAPTCALSRRRARACA